MTRWAWWLGVGAVAVAWHLRLAAGPGGGVSDDKAVDGKTFLSEADYRELAGRSLKVIQEVLGKQAEVDDRACKRVQVEAVLIAGYLQSSRDGGNPQLQDAVLNLSRLLADERLPEAQKLARSLPNPALSRRTGPQPVTETFLEGFGDVMSPLGLRMHGGHGVEPKPGSRIQDGIEVKLRVLAGKRLSKGELERQARELALMGVKTAVIADLARLHVPRDGRGKPRGDFVTWLQEVRDGSLELAEAARRRQAEALSRAALRVQHSCDNCHHSFRPAPRAVPQPVVPPNKDRRGP
jgi:hypothetical protein